MVLTLAGFSVNCLPYARGIPIGTPAPARPPDCKLSYAQIAPAEAQAEWRQVGDVCLSNEVYWHDDPRVALNEQACALGGEMVTPIGLCANGRSSGTEYGVYVRR